MTDMEKKVMVRLCAKILTETELYDTDMEVRNLIDWVCVSEQIKENNNAIRSLTGGVPEDRAGMPGGSAGETGTHEGTLQRAQ